MISQYGVAALRGHHGSANLGTKLREKFARVFEDICDICEPVVSGKCAYLNLVQCILFHISVQLRGPTSTSNVIAARRRRRILRRILQTDIDDCNI